MTDASLTRHPKPLINIQSGGTPNDDDSRLVYLDDRTALNGETQNAETLAYQKGHRQLVEPNKYKHRADLLTVRLMFVPV